MDGRRNAISTSIALATIIIVIIIALGGWTLYLTAPSKVTTTTVTGSGATATTTVTGPATTVTATNSYLAPTTSSASFTITGFTSLVWTAVWYAVQEGAAAQYIPNAKFEALPGAQPFTALTSGAAQMAFGDLSNLPTHGGYKLVANFGPMLSLGACLVNYSSSFTSLSQLHGGTFGISTPGAASQYITTWFLSTHEGWTVNQDYTLSAEGSVPAQYAALQAGTLDATCTGVSGTEWSLEASHVLRSVYNFTFPYQPGALFASDSFIASNPGAVAATVYAFSRAAVFWNSNETAALDIIGTHFHTTGTIAQFAYEQTVYAPDGAISLVGVQQATNLLVIGGAIPDNLTASSLISTEFVPILTSNVMPNAP